MTLKMRDNHGEIKRTKSASIMADPQSKALRHQPYIDASREFRRQQKAIAGAN
jgi:hypothetical protein